MRFVSRTTPAASRGGGIPTTRSLLQWVYLGRITVAIVVFVAAAFFFRAVPPETIVILAVAALTSVVVTSLSIWHTHLRRIEAGTTFLYAQVLFDLALVTTVVHVTEGPDSQFPALYVLVIAVTAIMMPLASSLLVTSLAALLYVADIVFLQPVELSVAVWLQLTVFVAVFAATGLIASRVRVMGDEREELQQEVRRLRLEASDILRNIRSGIVTVAGDGALLYANPAARELLDFGNREFLGRPFDELVNDRAPSLARAIRDTQESAEKTLRSESEVRAGGRAFPIGVTTTTIEIGGGGPPSVTAIFTDISDQKRVEELHLRTERLEAVAEFSASLAHEIKNPLASIRSSIEQLAGASRADDDERFLAQLVLRESDRLSRLLTEFLDFSRVQVTSSRSLDMGRVVEGAVDVVGRHPDCSDEVTIEVRRRPVALEGDEDLLHRVVANLILNAVQAGDGKGRVEVEVREAEAGEVPPGLPPGTTVVLSVADDGRGIPAEVRERLFDPFVSGRPGGSGLGLAIVQRAVLAHRGVVLVDSEPGRTVFRVYLPAKGPSEVAA